MLISVDLFPTILPDTVVAIESFGEPSHVALFPEEALIVRRAVEKRKREFAIARTCAHRAVMKLGFPPSPILRGSNGQPRWPRGVVGSITHCQDYFAAAAARFENMTAIGIDAEIHRPLPEDVANMVSSSDERKHLAGLPSNRTFWDRLLFSAKESVFKAWFPITQQWLDFAEVKITFIPESSSFLAHLVPRETPLSKCDMSHLHGRYAIRDDLLITAITVP